MSLVYVADNGAIIGIEENKIKIKYKDGMLRTLPIETVDGITLLGKAQLTTQSMEKFLSNGKRNLINYYHRFLNIVSLQIA